MNVLIVESPNKARTIGAFLPKEEWFVIATVGHFIDLPQKKHGLCENENGEWIGDWGIIPGKEDLVKTIKSLAVKDNEIYIATDDDTEGEKIAGDVVEYILAPNKITSYKRVTFHEITKKVVTEQLNNARHIDQKIINSQIARRFVDREVGYKMSNLIRWHFRVNDKNLPFDIGIGRVVSPALHLLAEREKEVISFVEEDKYSVMVEYIKNGVPFKMTVPTTFFEDTKKEMHDLIAELSNPTYKHIVAAYKPETTSKSPYPPLITSRLQRGAWYLFNMEPDRTMRVAQDLFHAGLITYHRTESYNMSLEAVLEIIAYLRDLYPDELIVQQKRVFKMKAGAHEAHEAIRPTRFMTACSPENIESFPLFVNAKLAKDHADLYSYIWYVAVSTQMVDALYDTSSAVIQVGQIKLLGRANIYALGWSETEQKIVPQSGWKQLYGQFIEPAEDDGDNTTTHTDTVLPRLRIGDETTMLDVKVVESTTRRPQRYGVGRFITTLENKKIGRPSTFAAIYKKLVATKAVSLKNGNMLVPTTMGMTIDDWISEYAPWLNSIEHTVDFHEKLDLIESGELKTPDPIVKEYSDLVADVAKTIEWVDSRTAAPTDAQIDYAKKIIKANGLVVDEEIIFSSQAEMKVFLEAHKKEDEKFGKCPKCRLSDVSLRTYSDKVKNEESNYFACLSRECDFRVWEITIDKFFVQFRIDFTKNELHDAIKKILSKKNGYLFVGFTKKDGTEFDAKVVLEETIYNNKVYWKPILNFDNKK